MTVTDEELLYALRFVLERMKQVVEPGKFASWIAPPRVGIDNKPGDFEYVKIAT